MRRRRQEGNKIAGTPIKRLLGFARKLTTLRGILTNTCKRLQSGEVDMPQVCSLATKAQCHGRRVQKHNPARAFVFAAHMRVYMLLFLEQKEVGGGGRREEGEEGKEEGGGQQKC